MDQDRFRPARKEKRQKKEINLTFDIKTLIITGDL